MKANFDRARVSGLPEIATSGTVVLFSLALLKFGIHLSGIGRYGFFRDELYYLACGRHLAWGYVDQPPFIAVVAWVSQHAFGTSLAATRLLPAAAGALLVFLTGLLARELGGGLGAQVLAAVTILFAPAVLAMNSFLSMNAFEPSLLGARCDSHRAYPQWRQPATVAVVRACHRNRISQQAHHPGLRLRDGRRPARVGLAAGIHPEMDLAGRRDCAGNLLAQFNLGGAEPLAADRSRAQ